MGRRAQPVDPGRRIQDGVDFPARAQDLRRQVREMLAAGKSDDEVRAMLEAETWMDGKTAVENGFADTVLEPLANLAQRAGTLQPTNIAMLQNAPAEVLALFDMTRVANARTAAPSPMKRHPGPLMNAATETSAAGGGAAPAATPAAAPAK